MTAPAVPRAADLATLADALPPAAGRLVTEAAALVALQELGELLRPGGRPWHQASEVARALAWFEGRILPLILRGVREPRGDLERLCWIVASDPGAPRSRGRVYERLRELGDSRAPGAAGAPPLEESPPVTTPGAPKWTSKPLKLN